MHDLFEEIEDVARCHRHSILRSAGSDRPRNLRQGTARTRPGGLDKRATRCTRADIENGREVWQTLGGLELGSIWGHGG